MLSSIFKTVLYGTGLSITKTADLRRSILPTVHDIYTLASKTVSASVCLVIGKSFQYTKDKYNEVLYFIWGHKLRLERNINYAAKNHDSVASLRNGAGTF